MADSTLTGLTELASKPTNEDILYIVDVSDTSDGLDGSSRQTPAIYLALTDGNASGVTITGSGTINLNGKVISITEDCTVVTDTGAQTLTNKTITKPTWTLKAGTTPTAEGDIRWGTSTSKIYVGDGSTTKAFSDDSVTTGVHGVSGTGNVVAGTTNAQTWANKTLTTPTIASLANAMHTHLNAAGGGELDFFQSQVIELYRVLGDSYHEGDFASQSATYSDTANFTRYTSIWIDGDKILSNQTVKLYAYVFCNGPSAVQLHNVTTAAAVTGSEATFSSGDAVLGSSGDFRTNLASGLNQYQIDMHSGGGGSTCILLSAHLVID